MAKKMCIATTIAVFLLGAGPATGTDFPGRWWWSHPGLAATLKLTDDEKRILDEKHVEAVRALLQMKGTLESKRFDLGLLLEQEPMDEARVKAQYREVEELRDTLIRERFRFTLETRRLLGAERFRQLKTIRDEFRARAGLKGEGRRMLR